MVPDVVRYEFPLGETADSVITKDISHGIVSVERKLAEKIDAVFDQQAQGRDRMELTLLTPALDALGLRSCEVQCLDLLNFWSQHTRAGAPQGIAADDTQEGLVSVHVWACARFC